MFFLGKSYQFFLLAFSFFGLTSELEMFICHFNKKSFFSINIGIHCPAVKM